MPHFQGTSDHDLQPAVKGGREGAGSRAHKDDGQSGVTFYCNEKYGGFGTRNMY